MRIFVFRPEADAERTARAIASRGHEAVLAPLFTIERLAEPAPEGNFAAIVLTSGNAVPALTDGPAGWRETPVFAVGARTAEKAREAGFAKAHSADGDRNDLIDLIRADSPAPARLLLIVGRDRHEDIVPRLTEAGYEIVLWEAYSAKAATLLPKIVGKALAEGTVDAALHYSPRGAETFVTLTRAVHLLDESLALTHVALSADVAAPLIAAGASTVLVAEYPEEAGLLAALDQVSARDRDESEPIAPTEPPASVGSSGRTPPTIDLDAQDTSATPQPDLRDHHAATPDAPPTEMPLPETDRAASEASAPSSAARVAPSDATKARIPWPALLAASVIGGLIGAGLVTWLGRSQIPSVDPAQIAELRTRIDGLQTATSAADRRAANATEAAGKAGAEAQANAARIVELAKAPAAPTVDPAALAGLTQRLDQTTARIGSVETLARTATAPSPQALAAARLVLSERVQQALASGQPFASDLAALAKGGGADAQIAPLRAVADTGAPTRDALLAQLRTNRALFAKELSPQDANWRDRLLGLASRVVSIRPAGDTGASDSTTLPQRLEAALTRNDVAAAVALWAQLPEPARRGSADFGASLQKRADADAAIGKITQDAVAALGAAG